MVCLRALSIGSILFLICINDIGHIYCGNTKLQLFADGAKIYVNVNTENASSLHQRLPDDSAEWGQRVAVFSCRLNVQLFLSQASRSRPYVIMILMEWPFLVTSI